MDAWDVIYEILENSDVDCKSYWTDEIYNALKEKNMLVLKGEDQNV